MVSISKQTYISNIWKNFYDILSNSSTGVTTVTLADESTQTVQIYTSSFPDKESNQRSSYPILVIETPIISEDDFTLTKSNVEGTINVEIYTTKSESAELFLDAIRNKIETNKDDLATLGLKPLRVDSTDNDFIMRGEIKVHIKSITFKFNYRYTKTRAW